jgi:hypothetical protein
MENPQPTRSAEQWLGIGDRRRLWERLNPRHRRLLRVLAHALVLAQDKARLPELARMRLLAALDELERVARRLEQFLTLTKEKNPRRSPQQTGDAKDAKGAGY